MLGIFFLRDVGLRYRRVQDSRKETTALRKLTLMEGANFPHTPALDNIILRQLLTTSFVINAAHFCIVHSIYFQFSSFLLIKLFNISDINCKYNII